MSKNGKRYCDKKTGRMIQITGKWRVHGWWTCKSDKGKKNHRIHEGTLKKFYDEV